MSKPKLWWIIRYRPGPVCYLCGRPMVKIDTEAIMSERNKQWQRLSDIHRQEDHIDREGYPTRKIYYGARYLTK